MNKKQILEIVLASLLALFLAGFIRVFFFDTYIVSNKSMEPTFYEGDQILLLKNNFLFNNIKNFDVIVFRMGTNNLVKRVVGKEGDKVEIFEGGLYLNDELIRHRYYIFSKEDNAVYNIGKGEYFVLGDNIALSEDSRHFGLINKKDIIGHIILIFSPKRRFKLFNNF